MPACNVLIIGAGFAGSVVAERLASAGQQILVIDQVLGGCRRVGANISGAKTDFGLGTCYRGNGGQCDSRGAGGRGGATIGLARR